MKRIYILILSLLLLIPLRGQILRYSNYTVPAPPAEVDSASWHAAYKEVYYTMTTRPGIDTANLQNILVSSLDTLSDGATSVWDRMDFFYLFAQRSNGAGEALINWINPGTFNADNPTSTTFTVYEGFTGNGSSMYISTNYNPSTDADNFTQNSATVGIYSRIELTGLDALYGNSASNIRLYPNYGGSCYFRLNTEESLTGAVTNSQGLFVGTRRSATEMEVYRNATSLANTTTNSSSAPSNVELLLLTGTGAAAFSSNQIAIAFILNAISDTEEAGLNTIVEAYMDAIGKGVQ